MLTPWNDPLRPGSIPLKVLVRLLLSQAPLFHMLAELLPVEFVLRTPGCLIERALDFHLVQPEYRRHA